MSEDDIGEMIGALQLGDGVPYRFDTLDAAQQFMATDAMAHAFVYGEIGRSAPRGHVVCAYRDGPGLQYQDYQVGTWPISRKFWQERFSSGKYLRHPAAEECNLSRRDRHLTISV